MSLIFYIAVQKIGIYNYLVCGNVDIIYFKIQICIIFIQLVIIPNLLPLEVVQNANIVNFVYYQKNRIEFDSNPAQHKNANIANFILAVPFKINKTDEVWNLEIQSTFHIYYYPQ